MTIVLFRVMNGSKVGEFDSEEKARSAMREYNTMYGYVSVRKMHWQEGIEMEVTREGIAPYGITEYERWNTKFNPVNQSEVDNNHIDIEYD